MLQPNDGCLTLARRLVRRGIDVHLLATPGYRHVLRSRGVTGQLMPEVHEDPTAWAQALAALGAERPGVLLSGADAATEWLCAHRASLPAALHSFESADSGHLALMSKVELYRIAAEAGVRTPWMHHVTTSAQLDELLSEVEPPFVLKPSLGHTARARVGIGTTRIDDRAQLRPLGERLLAHDLDFVLTELVPGSDRCLEGVTTVRDADGRYLLEYTRRKLRQWRAEYGVGSLMESERLPDTARLNRQLLDHAGFVGVSGCETKRHAGNGEVYLIEVNVRIPNGFGLAEACGVDGAWRLYAALAGLDLGPQPAQVDGRRVVFPEMDLRAVREGLRAGRITVPQALASWRGTRDHGAFSLRDPVPGLVVGADMVRAQAAKLSAARGRVRAS